MFKLCPPALIYLAFSLTQVIIDTFKGLYNTALVKTIVATIITILLNALCQGGMGIISWIIVFIPFIFMSVIVLVLLYAFGLDPATGQMKVICSNCDNTNTPNKGNRVFSTSGKPIKHGLSKYMDVTYSDAPPTSDEVNHYDYTTDPQH
jgi:hypothetical protein